MDVHPDEEEICVELMKEAMLSLKEECKSRFNIDYNVPVGIELKIGCDWSDLQEVCKDERV
jgi:hypothetical protein